MLFPRRIILWRPLRRRLSAGVTLCAYLVAIFGCPLPAAAHKDSDQPFPCQDHPCGCQTAEECWTKCCCLTPEQRWAWAEAHRVRPPAYAEKPASRGWRSDRLRDRDHGAKDAHTSCRHGAAPESCCTAHQAEPACCQAPKQGGTAAHEPEAQTRDIVPLACASGSCAHPPSDSAKSGDAKPNPSPASGTTHGGKGGKPSAAACAHGVKASGKGGVRWGLGVSAMNCRGLNTLWATTGAALPARPPLAWSPCLAPAGWTPARSESALLLPCHPLDPPPRGPLA